jgi:hypothetical protein
MKNIQKKFSLSTMLGDFKRTVCLLLNYFPHIIGERRNNEEYSEKKFSLSTMLGDFKRTVSRKNEGLNTSLG